MKNADLFSVAGKKAVITGGSRGIGLAAAQALGAGGAACALIARSPEVIGAAQSLQEAGIEAYAVRADLSDRAQREEAFACALKALGTVDILINNAGMASDFPAVDFPLEEWDKTLSLNLTCALELCQMAGRIMIARGSGKIINICSLHSYLGKRRIEAYAASKGGLALLTKSLAHEWAPFGVCVNGIVPGFIETEISASLRSDAVEYNKTIDRLPLGRWGQPDDLKGAFLFLASKASDYVIGHLLAVDGGILAI